MAKKGKNFCRIVKNEYLAAEKHFNLFNNNQKQTNMEKIIAEIKAQIEAIVADIDKVNNKAAKARVRKATLALEKIGKVYRKESIK